MLFPITAFQDNTDGEINWYKATGPRLNPNTGPNVDHTRQTEDGRFMFVDFLSSFPGTKARMYSQTYPQKTTSQCLIFWFANLLSLFVICYVIVEVNRCYSNNALFEYFFRYHMYGQGMGTMNIYVMKGTNYDGAVLLWSEEGDESDIWRHQKVAIPPLTYDFKVS